MRIADLTSSDWIAISELMVAIIGVITSVMVAYWIVDSIQKKIDNQRFLKDHFASEILSVREEYRGFIQDLFSEKVNKPKELKKNYRIVNIHASSLMELLKTNYAIEPIILQPFFTDLLGIITDCDEYKKAVKGNKYIQFGETTRNTIYDFLSKNDKLFNQILISLYNG